MARVGDVLNLVAGVADQHETTRGNGDTLEVRDASVAVSDGHPIETAADEINLDRGKNRVSLSPVREATRKVYIAPYGTKRQTEPSRSAPADADAMVSFNLSVRLTADDVERMTEEQRNFVLALAEKLRG